MLSLDLVGGCARDAASGLPTIVDLAGLFGGATDLAVAVNDDAGGGGGGGGGDDGGGGETGQPAGTIAINFSIDDSFNQIYGPGDLLWKSSMVYDPATRKVFHDPMWNGPWPPLWDDGPWTAGGHEPRDAQAGDHRFGVTVFATPPVSGLVEYEYGVTDTLYDRNFGQGWAWRGDNGYFRLAAGDFAERTVPGQVFPPFGTTDVQISIDSTRLDRSTPWDTSKAALRSSMWSWNSITLVDRGGGQYLCTLSSVVGPGNPFAHSGLLASGDAPALVILFGSPPREYRANGEPLTAGVSAAYRRPNGPLVPLPLKVAPGRVLSLPIP